MDAMTIQTMLPSQLGGIGGVAPAGGAPTVAANPGDVARFQQLMGQGAMPETASVQAVNGPAMSHASDAIRRRAGVMVNQVADRNEQLRIEGKELMQNIDMSDPASTLKVMSHTMKVMHSSTELNLVASVGSSVEKNAKMLFQAQN